MQARSTSKAWTSNSIGHAHEIPHARIDILYSANVSGPNLTAVHGKLDTLAAVSIHALLLAVSQFEDARDHLVVARIIVISISSSTSPVVTTFDPIGRGEHGRLHIHLATKTGQWMWLLW